MRISVIVSMPAGAALRASSATAFMLQSGTRGGQVQPRRYGPGALMLESTTPGAPIKKGDLQLDPNFPPLPLSGRTPEAINLATATASSAPAFVTRGTIDADRIDEVKTTGSGVQVFADPEIGLFPTSGCGAAPIGASADVERKLDVAALHAKKLDGRRIAVAIMDTGVNVAHLRAAGMRPKLDKSVFWAPPGVLPMPGAYPVDHGTMCAFDALIAAPRCTLLDFPILRSTTPGGSAMAGFLSDALLAYSYLMQQFNGPSWKYKALVINNSWGMYHPSWDFPAGHPGRYSDNPNHPFNIIVGSLARAGADILFAAGNCGKSCPDDRCGGVTKHTITGANAHPDVLTLAGCDVNDVRVGYSSQGPAIPGMAGGKPDVAAYTHFLGSQAFGVGDPDSGTSTSCPVAAGCVAALRTKLPASATSPRDLFDQFIATAQPAPGAGPGWNGDYGAGVIRPVAVGRHFGLC